MTVATLQNEKYDDSTINNNFTTWPSSTAFYVVTLSILFMLMTLPPTVLRPFHSKGEPREALVAQSMLQTGDWILPRRYENDFATKPPMAHWIIATSALLLGELNETSSRAPSFLAGLCTIIALFFFLKDRVSISFAFLASVFLMTSGLWFRSSLTTRVDMPLAGFLCCALFLMHYWDEKGYKNWPAYIGIILCLTSATLTKGPVALVLPAMIWTFYLVFKRKSFATLFITGLKLFLPPFFMSALWYVAAYMEGGQEFLDIVYLENFARMTGGMSAGKDPHQHSIFFLIGSLIAGLLPWSLLLFFVPWLRVFQFRGFSFKKGISFAQGLPDVYAYSLIVCLSIFGFYCIPSSKKAEYLLPLYPFLAILATAIILHFSSLSNRFLNRFCITFLIVLFLLGIPLLVVAAMPMGLLMALPLSQNLFFQSSLPEIISGMRWLIPVLLAGMVYPSLAIYRYVSQKQYPSIRYSFAMYVLAVIFIGAFIIPPVTSELSAKKFALEINHALPSEENIYSNEFFYGIDFYLGGKIKALKEAPEDTTPIFALVSKNRLEEFKGKLPSSDKVEVVLTAPNDIRKPGGLVQLVKVSHPSA